MVDTLNVSFTLEKLVELGIIDDDCLEKGIIGGNGYDYKSYLKTPYVQQRYIKGNCRNITVEIRERTIKVFGSLCKFYLGNSFQTLSSNQIGEAIDDLSEAIGLPIREGVVTRFDIGTVVVLNNPINCYLGNLLKKKGTKRDSTYIDTLYFTSSSSSFLFYDKSKEAKSKRRTIPSEYKEQNILRFEQRFEDKKIRKNLSKHFGSLKGNDITDISLLLYFIQILKEEYQKIPKCESLNMDSIGEIKVKNGKEMLIAKLIYMAGGASFLDSEISLLRLNPLVKNRNVPQLICKDLYELIDSYIPIENDRLKLEFDSVVIKSIDDWIEKM